jgi:DNA-binding Lrp family transcriptional regulator
MAKPVRKPVIWDIERPALLRPELIEGELDGRLIEALKDDGRASNSELARRFGVSEALIRQRLKRLISNGALRHQAVADQRELGLGHIAVVHAAISPRALQQVADDLCKAPGVATVFVLSGRYNIMFYLMSEDAAASRLFIDTYLAPTDGVVDVSVNTIIASYKFDGSTGFVLEIQADE